MFFVIICKATINNSFKIFDVNRDETKIDVAISATHNAYLNKFGFLHKRLIKLFKKNGNIMGTDTLIKKKSGSSNASFSIRFHIYPGINTARTVGGRSILLQISKNKSWIFLSDDRNLEIEKSLFLGRNKILNNQCIVIYGNTEEDKTDIKWELRKTN